MRIEIKTDVKRLRVNVFCRILYGLLLVLFFLIACANLNESIDNPRGSSVSLRTALIIFFIHYATKTLPRLPHFINLAFKKSHVICSISEKDFTDHRTNRVYYWEDIESIRLLGDGRDVGGRAAYLELKLKNKLRKVVLEEMCASNESNKEMIVHVLKYAPKNLTDKLKVPVYKNFSQKLAMEFVCYSFIYIVAVLYFYPFILLMGLSPLIVFLILFVIPILLMSYPIYYLFKKYRQ